MCLLSAVYQVIPECPLLVLSNRDEAHARPTENPQIVASAAERRHWLGGLDIRAGGTWLGLNADGVMIAITNRPQKPARSGVRSRGLLCRDLLACSSVEAAVEQADRELRTVSYAGCNVLILSKERAAVVEADNQVEAQFLEPGIHTIANGDLNDLDDPRVRVAGTQVSARITARHSTNDAVLASQAVCSLTDEDVTPGICITKPEWGTVSSTIIALTETDNGVRYLYSPGPPNRTDYVDFSRDAVRLLVE